MAHDDFPPPLPMFLVYAYSFLIPLFLCTAELMSNESTDIHPLPPPTFLVFHLNALMLVFTVLIATLQENDNEGTPLIRLLFPHFHGRRNRGSDVWGTLQQNPVTFWYMTGETPESLDVMVERMYMDVSAPRHLPRTPRSDRRRPCILDVRNRVLLVIIWLRQYLKLHVLAHLFQISKSTVAEEIYHVVPILFTTYQHFIRWHGLGKWRTFLDTFPSFPNGVGMIDGTIHPVRRPSGPLQAEFYRGDKKCHFMSSQVVVDADGLIVLLVTGFPGHMNDAACYRMIPRIDFGRARNLPRRARLLADGGYGARVPLVVPRRNPLNRRQRQANRALRSIRIKIEHSIGFEKIYTSTNSIFRHKRCFLPYVVSTCGFLSNRRKLLIRRLRN